MKKLLTILLISVVAFLTTTGFAQSQWQTESRPDSTKKAKYQYFVKVPVQDYQQLLNLVSSYRNSTTYNPTMQPAEKLNEQAGVDRYLFNLSKRVKLDSLKVK